jgi:signal transduction histidine kinase
MCHDITDRQHAAAERERLLHEAQEAILIRDDFLSVAAHELKTPLTALQLNIEMIQRIARKDDDSTIVLERVVRKLEGVEYQLNRLGYLTKQLLDVTQLREGRLHLQLEILDLSQVAATIAEQFEGQLLAANCSLMLELMPGQMIEADQSALDHIITNLLGNAVKYGSGQPIELRVVGDTSTVKLVVRDYGIGIADTDQQRIFERFERAVSHKGFSGLGLGLYVVQQLVSALHGTITVESQIGSGSTFTVAFPRRDQ